jgi:alkanesulfonate monooxygenase SsuD/methylene tetrahydromethanopterin reductase-like flavin-dependent oxidoreductase (luciferase family)
MQTWYFSEQSYPDAWNSPDAPKITPPSSSVDPKKAHQILQDFIQECELADRLGLNIMVNEHHAAYTCMSVSCMTTLALLAGRTKSARLLALGIPMLNRLDPLRIAEEIAYVDVLSAGRLEVGLVKGSPFEPYASNANTARGMERYWEAHDLIVAALTSDSGSFSWEGKYFNYRNVNVIPRCYQQPKPQIWVTTLGSTGTAQEAARLDYVLGITANAQGARNAYPKYREEYLRIHQREAALDRFAFLGYFGVAKDEATAWERAEKVIKFVETSERVSPNFLHPPGYYSTGDAAKMLRGGKAATHRLKVLPDGTPMSAKPIPQEYVKNGVMFAGTPDQVYEQIVEIYDSVGGFGHLLFQLGGTLTTDETRESIELFANEVQPRLMRLTSAGKNKTAA